MTINKIRSVCKDILEIVMHVMSEVERRHESGELAHVDVPLMQDIESFKAKHPVAFKVINFFKSGRRFFRRLYMFLKEHKYIQAIA